MADYSIYSDQELVNLLRADDMLAFRMLYDRYWKKMLVKVFTQLQSHADAEEVVQDVFVNLWRRRATLQIKYTFHTYIASVVRYETMAKIAVNKRSPVLTEDGIFNAIVDDATQEWLAFSDLQQEVEAAIMALPEKCRLVFRMSREQGMTEKQISQELEISQKTVQAHMGKALKSLRQKLNHNFMVHQQLIHVLMMTGKSERSKCLG